MNRDVPKLDYVNEYYEKKTVGTGAVGKVEKLFFNPYKYLRDHTDSEDSTLEATVVRAREENEKKFLMTSKIDIYESVIERAKETGDKILEWCCQNPILAGKTLMDNSPDQRARFMREIRTLYNFKHPNIMPIAGYTEDPLAYFMPYIKRIQLENKRFKPGPVVRVALKISKALEYMHDQDFLHRDIKPHNIIVSEDWQRVLLSDFGIAKSLSPSETAITSAGMIVGTPEYMPPEYVDPNATAGLTKFGDIFSLGATLYALLTGKAPLQFFTSSDSSILARCAKLHILEEFRSLRDIDEHTKQISESIEDVVMMMIAKNPADRPTAHQSAILWEKISSSQEFEYRPSTFEENIKKLEKISVLEKTAAKVQNNPAGLYELLGKLYPRDKDNVTKRKLAFKQSQAGYEELAARANSEEEYNGLKGRADLARIMAALEERRYNKLHKKELEAQ